jgi:hypothetical protein
VGRKVLECGIWKTHFPVYKPILFRIILFRTYV